MNYNYGWVRYIVLIVGIIGVFLGSRAGAGNVVMIISAILLVIGLLWTGVALGQKRKKC